jgi:colanic acid biosynthesis protein WcaH
MKKLIPAQTYKQIVERMPIACVDLVVKSGSKFLFLKRKDDPAKGMWWFPGGRIFFNEKLENTVSRKLKEEINVAKPLRIKFLGVGETMFKKGKFGKPMHTINSVFLAEISPKQAQSIKLDQTSSGYKWLGSIGKSFHPYLKDFLKKAGFK